MVESGSLENCCPLGDPEFESLPLRHLFSADMIHVGFFMKADFSAVG